MMAARAAQRVPAAESRSDLMARHGSFRSRYRFVAWARPMAVPRARRKLHDSISLPTSPRADSALSSSSSDSPSSGPRAGTRPSKLRTVMVSTRCTRFP